jgi:hypothetical protein
MIGETAIVTPKRGPHVAVDPPHGDAIQKFDALELPIVELVERRWRP